MVKYYVKVAWIFSLLIVCEKSFSEIKNNSQTPITISSDKAIYDEKNSIIELHKNVLLIYKDISFQSDYIALTYERKDSRFPNKTADIQKIFARGNVIFKRNDQTIKSSSATFSPVEDIVTLSGNVTIINEEKVKITSEELEINLSTGNTSFKGRVNSSTNLED